MQRKISPLKNQHFDILVCGGGIYGAWTAYDAALRGLKVALVDKGDWAGATSSASSKLIHGGLRYLETMDFKLVRKSLAEREMLLNAAPHRVWPLRFGIPVYKDSRLGPIRLKIGLALYDLLAGRLGFNRRHQHHSKSDFISHFPCLDTAKLTEGFSYADAQTDDARLVLELVDGACSAGAICINYCEVMGFKEQDGKINAATLHDRISDETIELNVSLVVDATGRWSSTLQAHEGYRITKGVHLILPPVLQNEALLLTAQSDGRVFFIIPWYGLTLVGTTDTDYNDDIENVPISKKDIAYLLSEANHALKTVCWTEQDIIGKFVGLRVLRQSSNGKPSSISRDWILTTARNGLLSSIGGKLSSARADAEQIVDTVCQRLGKKMPCQTFGKPFPWLSRVDFQTLLDASLPNAKALGIDDVSALWLIRRHGERSKAVFQLCENRPDLVKRIKPELPFIWADLIFCARHEMVVHLDDLLRRRLPLMILAKMSYEELSRLAESVAIELNWHPTKTAEELKRCLPP